MVFKCIKGLVPPSVCNKFTTRSQVHTRNTTNNNKLNIPFFRSATGQRSFSNRAVKLWNDLPESLTNMESFNVFKNAIKVDFQWVLRTFGSLFTTSVLFHVRRHKM